MKMSGLKTFLQLAVVLSVVGFHSIAQAQTVSLEVNDSQDKLIVTSHGNCSSNNANGCVRASGKIQINFNLKNTSCAATGESWDLSQVILGNSENSQGNISAVAASDFDANQSSGVVTPTSQSARHISIRDDNTEAYTVWYTVTASCGSSTIDSDPRIVNDGSGHR